MQTQAEIARAGPDCEGQTPISDLDLYHLSWETPEFAAAPYGEFEAARQRHPWLAGVNGAYVVYDLVAIRDLLVRDDLLRTSFDEIVDIMNARGSRWGRFAAEQMIALPEREHATLRNAFAARFTPRYANQMRPIMRETMSRLLGEWLPKQQIDFEVFASYYPVAVMASMIGAPLDCIPELRDSMETLGLAFSMNPAMLPKLDDAMEKFDAFASELIAQRRANPRSSAEGESDLLDLLISAGDNEGISERQLMDLVIFLFVAGYDTSKNVLTYTMNTLLEYPEIYRRCAQDHDYCKQVVEEALRMFTPSSTFRAAKSDFVYRGVLIPEGTVLFFTLNVAGRISRDIEDANTFDPERPAVAPRHVGFGLGKHMCLGQYIARAQLAEGLHLIARHMANPRATAEPGWRPFPGAWGIDGLPIEFDPVAISPAN